MNPVDWLKTLYGWLGAGYPRASLIGAVVFGAVLGAVVWKFAAYVYTKDRSAIAPVPSQPTVITTTGPNSPVMPNNSGTVMIGNGNNLSQNQPSPKSKQK